MDIAPPATDPAPPEPARTSVFELFRIGIGPSSSHTVGPMRAASDFVRRALAACGPARPGDGIRCSLFGSLALTGSGHGTQGAVCLGLLGHAPETIDPDLVPDYLARLREGKAIQLPDGVAIRFDPDQDIELCKAITHPGHPNTMRFDYVRDGAPIFDQLYFSVGGGFIEAEGESGSTNTSSLKHYFNSAATLLQTADAAGLSIARLMYENEATRRPAEQIDAGLDAIWAAMQQCVARGLAASGELPGGLRVRRRAPELYQRLKERRDGHNDDMMMALDWVNLFALAVNEENAGGGRVVTAPTNGAAGIIPAVLMFYRDFDLRYTDEKARTFLLTAAAVGAIIKRNASISGADMGCQGEVGSAAAMAAAGLAAIWGGTNDQIENAAEIALEHSLGLTCDPVGGLVQIPCIERNAIAAVKAVNAARLALHGDGSHRVSLDEAIETMRQTGLDMQSKYKETSLGGLAVNVIAC